MQQDRSEFDAVDGRVDERATDAVLDLEPPLGHLVTDLLPGVGDVTPAGRDTGEYGRLGAAQGLVGQRGGQRVHREPTLVAGHQRRRVVPGQIAGVDVAVEEVLLAKDPDQQVAVGDHPEHARLGQRAGQQPRGLLAGRGMRDHLSQHRVVVHADLPASLHSGVDADAGQGWHVEQQQRAGGRQVSRADVLGVEPRLDRMTAQAGPYGFVGQRLALGHSQLQGDQVQAGNSLGDWVLDLQPGVDLEEEKLAGGVEDELDRAGADVADRLRGRDRRRPQLGAQRVVDDRRRRLLQDLLVPPLDRALPLEQVHDLPVGVGEDLHLDVPGALDQPFEEDRAVAERADRLPPRGGDRLGQLAGRGNDPHATTAPAEGGLDQHREPDLGLGAIGQSGRQLLPVTDRDAGQHRHPGPGHQLLGRGLGAHGPDRRRRRADEGQSCGGAGFGEVRVLRQEPVAGVHRVGAGTRGRVDDQLRAQIGFRGRAARQRDRLVGLGHERRPGIGVREHRDGRDVQGPCGADYPGGDLAAVGDEQFPDARHLCHPRPLTSGRRRSRGVPRSPGNGRPTGRWPAQCGCRAGR